MHVGDFRNRRESPSESLYRWAIYKHAWTDPWLSARSISIPQHSSSGKIHTFVCQRLLVGMVPIPQYTTVSAFSQSIVRTACAWSLSLIGLELLRINASEMTDSETFLLRPLATMIGTELSGRIGTRREFILHPYQAPSFVWIFIKAARKFHGS